MLVFTLYFNQFTWSLTVALLLSAILAVLVIHFFLKYLLAYLAHRARVAKELSDRVRYWQDNWALAKMLEHAEHPTLKTRFSRTIEWTLVTIGHKREDLKKYLMKKVVLLQKIKLCILSVKSILAGDLPRTKKT